MSTKLYPRFNPKDFLTNTWQKKPKLIKEFLPYNELISSNELAGLACEDFVESRLIEENPPHKIRHGPFKEEVFKKLPNENWTLLVQSVDLYDRRVRMIKDSFSFLPSWRLDDIMVSYATAEAGVGPHFDHYDVFLIQGEGRRKWQLGQFCDPNTKVDNSSGLDLLRNFSPTEEFVLEEGDALYIPPHMSHNGTSISNSLCYSVGFRAPSAFEMYPHDKEGNVGSDNPFRRFKNINDSEVPSYDCEIANRDLRKAFNSSDSCDYEGFCRSFGAFVTQPRYKEIFSADQQIDSLKHLLHLIDTEMKINLHPASRIAFCELEKQGLVLFFNDGRTYPVDLEEIDLVRKMNHTCCYKSFINNNHTSSCAKILLDMVRFGSLELS